MPEGNEQAPNTPPAGEEHRPPRANDRKDVNAVVQRLVSKYGSADAALAVLADENLDYRRENDALRGKVPEGARVLTKKETADYEAFLALGKSVKEVNDLVTTNATLAAENAEHRATQTATEAAKAIGSDKPAVLAKILKAEGYRLEIKDEKDGDEQKRVAYAVRGEGDAAEATELAALLTTTLADYRPALLTEQPPQKPAPGTQYPPQAPRGTAPTPKEESIEQLKQKKAATGAYFA